MSVTYNSHDVYRAALITADRAFGDKGRQTVELWQQYNKAYFAGQLRPIPIIYVPTSTYGVWIGCTRYNRADDRADLIYLMRKPWEMVRAILLHEMIHQYLFEAKKNPSHDGQPWRDEIMQISRDYFDVRFWAGRVKVIKEKQPDGSRRSKKVNEADSGGKESLTQGEIAHWPHSVGIVPPELDGTWLPHLE